MGFMGCLWTYDPERLFCSEPHLLRVAHRLGLPVHVWTVNDAPQIQALLELGVDGVGPGAAGASD
ncbi:MAG TPA: glycerophosphodiester phosphodiesterase family protein [Actinomycetes bacterium]